MHSKKIQVMHKKFDYPKKIIDKIHGLFLKELKW